MGKASNWWSFQHPPTEEPQLQHLLFPRGMIESHQRSWGVTKSPPEQLRALQLNSEVQLNPRKTVHVFFRKKKLILGLRELKLATDHPSGKLPEAPTSDV